MSGLFQMGGQELDLLNTRRMQEELAKMNEQMNSLPTYQAPAPIEERSVQSSALPPVQPAEQPKPSFMQRIGTKLKDPAYRAQLAAAFNTMRLNPDPNIAQRAADMRKEQKSLQGVNQTVQYLRAQGRPDLANIVEQNPTMASEVLKSMLGTQHMSKVGAIQTDPVTGQQYFTEYDPNTGKTRRVDVEGAIGETASQKAAREAKLANLKAGRDAASAKGRDYFDRATTIGESIDIMKSARDLAVKGVMTGIAERYLPAVDANTQMFRNLQKDLGINVINSATFGALSEKELELATTKDIPSSLKGQELLDYLDAKIAAQNKMFREMNRKARRLQSGITLGQYLAELENEIDENYRILAAYPQGDPDMTYAMWTQMSANDRKAYLEAEE